MGGFWLQLLVFVEAGGKACHRSPTFREWQESFKPPRVPHRLSP